MESKKFIGMFLPKIKFLSADYIFSIDNYFNSGIYGCHTGLCVVFAAFILQLSDKLQETQGNNPIY